MKVIVTVHAVEQYKRRSFNNASDKDILNLLAMVARKGEIKCRRPPYDEEVYKVSRWDHAVVAKFCKDHVVILTYLGSEKYQKWYERMEMRPRVAGL